MIKQLRDIAIGVEGLWFGFQAYQIRHSVSSGPPPWRCFSGCVVEAISGGEESRHSLHALVLYHNYNEDLCKDAFILI